jgi:hypothetical protein
MNLDLFCVDNARVIYNKIRYYLYICNMESEILVMMFHKSFLCHFIDVSSKAVSGPKL